MLWRPQERSPAEVGVSGLSVSVHLCSADGLTLFCITEASPPPTTNRHDVFRHIQVFSRIQRKKDQTIREERMSFVCRKESSVSNPAGETSLWVKRTQTLSLEPPVGRKSGKPSHTRALRGKAKFSKKNWDSLSSSCFYLQKEQVDSAIELTVQQQIISISCN